VFEAITRQPECCPTDAEPQTPTERGREFSAVPADRVLPIEYGSSHIRWIMAPLRTLRPRDC